MEVRVPTSWLSWDLVLKLATLVILVFTGASTDHLVRTSRELEKQTAAVETTVEGNKATLDSHAHATTQMAQLMTELRPLFQDLTQRLLEITQRQYAILGALEQAQEGQERSRHRLEQASADLHTLLTLHQRLMEQCPPAPPP